MGPRKERRRAPEYITTGKQTSSWRDEEIRERVKIPVDERLGGCRGFKSHRPHHRIYFAVERRCFASIVLARSMSSASFPAVMALCENHESSISFAMAVDVLLRLSAN